MKIDTARGIRRWPAANDMATRHPMRTDVHAGSSSADLAKWIGAFVVLASGIGGF